MLQAHWGIIFLRAGLSQCWQWSPLNCGFDVDEPVESLPGQRLRAAGHAGSAWKFRVRSIGVRLFEMRTLKRLTGAPAKKFRATAAKEWRRGDVSLKQPQPPGKLFRGWCHAHGLGHVRQLAAFQHHAVERHLGRQVRG
jgi:hypothetical protein